MNIPILIVLRLNYLFQSNLIQNSVKIDQVHFINHLGVINVWGYSNYNFENFILINNITILLCFTKSNFYFQIDYSLNYLENSNYFKELFQPRFYCNH